MRLATRLTLILIVLVLTLSALPLGSVVCLAEEITNPVVDVVYLQQIPDTCFAIRVKKSIRIPVSEDHKISKKDVGRKAGIEALGVLNSWVKEYRYNDEGNYYFAVYEKAVYVNAKNVDGYSAHYFLDLNYTFDDYFNSFVRDVYGNYIPDDVRSKVWNDAKNNFPALGIGGYDPNEVYGYWGFVAIPGAEEFKNIIFEECFFVEKTTFGNLHSFPFQDKLPYSKYYNLLKDYDFPYSVFFVHEMRDVINSWLGREEQCDTTFYFFYTDGSDSVLGILENGADNIYDNRSGSVIQTEKAIGEAVESIKDLLTNDNFRKIVGIIGGVLALLLFAYVLFKLTPILRRINRKENEKRQKEKEKEQKSIEKMEEKQRKQQEKEQLKQAKAKANGKG